MNRWLLLALVSTGASAAAFTMAEFASYDRNRDGFVDRVEVVGSVDLQGRFAEIDLDTDGRISAAEMQAWIDEPNKPSFLQAKPIDFDQQRRDIEAARAEAAARQASAGTQPIR
jgi:hypothetical protein